MTSMEAFQLKKDERLARKNEPVKTLPEEKKNPPKPVESASIKRPVDAKKSRRDKRDESSDSEDSEAEGTLRWNRYLIIGSKMSSTINLFCFTFHSFFYFDTYSKEEVTGLSEEREIEEAQKAVKRQ